MIRTTCVTRTPNAVAAKGGQMAIRSISADSAPKPNITDTTAVVVGSRSTRLAGVAKRLLATSCLGLAVVSSTGCTVTSGVCRAFNQSECIDEFMIGYRNTVMAEKAWHCNKHRFCDHLYTHEFKDGFIKGYLDVASGGNGCTPAVAPSDYWGWRYQSSHGQAAVNAWFEGFPHGVQAAEQDGVSHWQSVSPMGMNPAAEMPVYTPINSGDDGVTNPFYSEPEYIPVPQADEQDDFETNPKSDGAVMEDAGTVFNEAFRDFPVAVEISADDPELVSQLEVARSHEAAVVAKLADQMEEAPEAAAVVIDDIFGSSTPVNTDTDSDELPFSFE